MIDYSEFKEAEFGIGNGQFVFCLPRKCWKSETGNKIIELINKVCLIKDIKAYKQYTEPFFFIHMFK